MLACPPPRQLDSTHRRLWEEEEEEKLHMEAMRRFQKPPCRGAQQAKQAQQRQHAPSLLHAIGQSKQVQCSAAGPRLLRPPGSCSSGPRRQELGPGTASSGRACCAAGITALLACCAAALSTQRAQRAHQAGILAEEYDDDAHVVGAPAGRQERRDFVSLGRGAAEERCLVCFFPQ